MAVVFASSRSRLPGLNFEAPPGILDLEFVFDQVFAGEQRTRLQLGMAAYRDAGPQYGIADQLDPATAGLASGRPLIVQPNAGDPLVVDIEPGVAVTRAGNVIVVTERVAGVPLASSANTASEAETAQPNVVLLEYGVIDDATTNVVTEYNTTEAVRRIIRPAFDALAFNTGNVTTFDSQHNSSNNLVKIVKMSTFRDIAIFSPERLNDVVVLAVVKVTSNTDGPPVALAVDMTRSAVPENRPWFSQVDQQHRAQVGTGSPGVPHQLGFNDLSAGSITLAQQVEQHGVVLSRDRDVPGCPGRLCREHVDVTRVYTDDGLGSTTGFAGRRYVLLESYPTRLLGLRYNKLIGGTSVGPDDSLAARVLGAELIPGTNILVLAPNEVFDSILGFSVYYTSSDAARPPALPHDVTKIAGDVMTFGTPGPADRELVIAGGKMWPDTPSTTFSFATAGPIPREYRVWLDASRQYVASPQVVSCTRLLTDITTTVQTPDFPMYGPAPLRVGLWNAFLPVSPTLDVRVELVGRDLAGAGLIETVGFTQANWLQPFPVPACPRDAQVPVTLSTTAVFGRLDSWRVISNTSAGNNAVVQVWADIRPTVTPALDDALPVARVRWNGQSICRVRDDRPVVRVLGPRDSEPVELDRALVSVAAVGLAGTATPLRQVAGESFRDPRYCDHILSRLDRHGDGLRSVAGDDDIDSTFWLADGTGHGLGWYYSRGLAIPTTGLTLVLVLYGEQSYDQSGTFGRDAQVQYQTFNSGNAQVDGWTDASTLVGGNPRIRVIAIGGTRTKVRFRMAGRGLSGWSLVVRTP